MPTTTSERESGVQGVAWRVGLPTHRGGWVVADVPAVRGQVAAVASDTGGPGSGVVLVHGIGMSSRYFTALHDELATDRRVIVPDLLGYGGSRRAGPPGEPARHARAVAALLDQLQPGPCVLVGHSMGAQVVTELALRRPELTRAVVLLGPVTDPRARSALRQAARLLRDGVHEPPGVNLVITRDYLRCGPRRYLADLPAMLRHPLAARLAGVRQPVHLVRGAQDPICPARFLRELAAARPGASLVEVPGVGHVVMHGGAATVARICRAAG